MTNAGKYNRKIQIIQCTETEDNEGFKKKSEKVILTVWAAVKTLKGYTLITSGTDFEKAYTNFTIRFPKTRITRDMLIRYNGKVYTIEYLNNVNESNVELEIQAKEVTK